MKLLRFRAQRGLATGVLTEHGVVDLGSGFDDFTRALSPEGRSLAAKAVAGGTAQALEKVRLATPLATGARVFCIGLNYKDHVAETGRDMPPQPSVFLRTHESLVAQGEPMRRPRASTNFDFEGELTVVIGASARNIQEAEALSCVAGYTCLNDGSLRDFQKHSVTAGKNFDASGACGPWVVTADEIPDPTKLELCTRLNGQEVQKSGTDKLIYSIPFILSYISAWTELRPGDVIATGTPSGVGSRRTPPLWMKAGDRIEVDISGIGILANPIEEAK